MTRNLNLLMAVVGIIGANSLMLAPVSATVGLDLDRTPETVMRASAVFGLATAFAALTLAPLIDRIGAARALGLSLAALASAFVLSAVSQGFTTLAVAQGLAGLASGVALPAAYALAAEIAPPGRAAAALGRVLTGWTLALVFGVTLSAILADLLHWRATYALIALAALGLIRPSRRLPNRPGGTASPPWTALPLPGVAAGLLAQLALMVGFYGTYSFLGAHLAERGLAAAQAAIPVLAYGIGFGLSGRLDPWLDRRGYSGAGPVVFLSVAACLTAIGILGHGLTGLTVSFFAWGLANHLALGLIVGRLTASAGARKGAVLGLNSAVTYLAVVIGAAGFAPIFSAGGLSLCAGIGAGLAALLAIEARVARPAPQT